MRQYLFLLTLLFLVCAGEKSFAQLGDEESEYDLRIKAILDELEYKYVMTDAGDFSVTLELEEKRAQSVIIKSRTEFYDEMEIREIWSVGYVSEGEVPGDVANLLLKNSFDQKIGAWQVVDDAGTSIAIFAIKMSANANAVSVRSAIFAAIRNADAIEMELNDGADTF